VHERKFREVHKSIYVPKLKKGGSMIKCKQANVRFTNQNLHQQRIRYSDYTGASSLCVILGKEFVTVSYMYKDAEGKEKPLKILNFNTSQLVEVDCEEIFEVLV